MKQSNQNDLMTKRGKSLHNSKHFPVEQGCVLLRANIFPVFVNLESTETELTSLAFDKAAQQKKKKTQHMKLALLSYFRKQVKCSSPGPAAQCQHLFQGWMKTHKRPLM